MHPYIPSKLYKKLGSIRQIEKERVKKLEEGKKIEMHLVSLPYTL